MKPPLFIFGLAVLLAPSVQAEEAGHRIGARLHCLKLRPTGQRHSLYLGDLCQRLADRNLLTGLPLRSGNEEIGGWQLGIDPHPPGKVVFPH